jgi:hypothetical protein
MAAKKAKKKSKLKKSSALKHTKSLTVHAKFSAQ